MQTGGHGVLLRGLAMIISALPVLSASPVYSQPVSLYTQNPPDGFGVVDIRSEGTCLEASLPDARCLPADWIMQAKGGNPISFHALRWLLGTIGLNGQEELVIYAGPGQEQGDAWAVAAMIYLAGQSQVFIHNEALMPPTEGGQSRSFSREAVYTAPMRSNLMEVTEGTAASLYTALIRFAQEGGTIAFTPDT